MNISRYFSSNLMYNEFSKTKKIQSKPHLEWIRNQPCVVTGHRSYDNDAHHVQRKSQGLNDYATVPLRHDIHMELHLRGITTFETEHGMDFRDALIAKLCERIFVLEDRI